MALKMFPAIPKMMPKDFLYSLPRVHDLTSDDKCPICLENYQRVQASAPGIIGQLVSMVRGPEPIDTEAEYAVRLPCQHVLGIDCIKRWVSPVEGGQSTCPYCVQQLFKPSRYPVSTHPLWDPLIDRIARYGFTLRRDGQWKWDQKQACAALSAMDIMDVTPLAKTHAAMIALHFGPSVDQNKTLQQIATARLTMHMREVVVYLQLQTWRVQLPAIRQTQLDDSYPCTRLEKDQREAMFRALEQKEMYPDKVSGSLRHWEDWEAVRVLGIIPQPGMWNDDW